MSIEPRDLDALLKTLRLHGLCLTYFGSDKQTPDLLNERLTAMLGSGVSEVVRSSAFTSQSFGLDAPALEELNAGVLNGSPRFQDFMTSRKGAKA